MAPKYSPILWDDPQKCPQKSSYPQKILIFQESTKKVKFKMLNPQKMTRAYVCMQRSDYSPPPPAPIQLA